MAIRQLASANILPLCLTNSFWCASGAADAGGEPPIQLNSGEAEA
jgi:hypothetical protein